MAKDDISYLLEKVKSDFISADRPKAPPRPDRKNEDRLDRLGLAVAAVYREFFSGKWIRKARVVEIAKQNNVDFVVLADICKLAESDNGWWMCLPREITSDVDPEEEKEKEQK